MFIVLLQLTHFEAGLKTTIVLEKTNNFFLKKET